MAQNMKLCVSIYCYYRKRKENERVKGRRWWVCPLFTKTAREKFGAGNNLINELRHFNVEEKHHNFFRMGAEQFDQLLHLVGPRLEKVNVRREPITSQTRLAITLRYLASGDSMASLTYLFRVGLTTISNIIAECMPIIWEVLSPLVLKPPSEDQWIMIADGFKNNWQFPNCIGAIDGKHICIQAPPNSGSDFFNYKGSHSIVLMAVVDHKYMFTLVDIGAKGRQSDGGILKESKIGRKLENHTLNIPKPSGVSKGRPPLPFVIVGDEAFPLSTNLMRPYPGRSELTIEKADFNYRLSRARRISENAFGILVSRWRIFVKPIIASIGHVDNVVKSTVCLHNFIMKQKNTSFYLTPGLVDNENSDGTITAGQWRNLGTEPKNVGQLSVNNYTYQAKGIRESFTEYFNEEGAIPWQWDRI